MPYDPHVDNTGGTAVATTSTGAPKFPGTGSADAGVSRYWWKQNVIVNEGALSTGGWSHHPHYQDAELKTVGQMLLDFDTKGSPDEVTQLQSLLYHGGFYSKNPKTGLPFTAGERDSATRAAFAKALKESVRTHTAFGTFLDDRATARQSQLDATPSKAQKNPPLTIELTNPDDLKRVFSDALLKQTGTGVDLNDPRLAAAVAAFQGKERNFQTEQYAQQYDPNAQGYGEGGTTVKPPDATTFATETAKKVNPVGFRAHEYLDAFSSIQSMLGGTNG